MSDRGRIISTGIVAGLLLQACSGPPQAPGAPSPMTPAVTAISLSGPSLVLTGQTVPLRGVLTLADGTPVPTEKLSWSTDAPSVAVVDHRGHVTGVALGVASISAATAGYVATWQLRVSPNYNGTWTGQYEVTRCFCRNRGRSSVGALLSMQLVLKQTDDRVVGTLSLEDMRSGNVRGQVALDGTLTLEGVWDPEDRLGPFVWRHYWIMDWKSTVTGATMSGFLRFGWPDAHEIDAKIISVTKR